MKELKCCVYCGQKIEGKARFCTLCGKQQNIAPPESEDGAGIHVQAKKAEKLGIRAKNATKTAFEDISQRVRGVDVIGVMKNSTEEVVEGMTQSVPKRRHTKGHSSKQKVSLFATEFIESEDAAHEIVERNNQKLDRCQKGVMIAGIASLCWVIFYFLSDHNFPEVLLCVLSAVAIASAIISYVFAGGILLAVKTMFKLAKIGWYIVPFFFLDLAAAAVGLAIGLAALIYLPIIYVGLSYIQTRKNIKEAEIYLGISRT